MNASSRVHIGPDLEEVSQENVEFLGISTDIKLRILPEVWPDSQLPQPTSTLMSIANRSGLIAAASPSTLIIATTQSIRSTFSDSSVQASDGIKPYTPQATISVPRLSQVAFSSNEAYLVICAAEGGGLQVYDVSRIKSGNLNPEFSISTEGAAIRSLLPNPAEESAHLFAVILASGKLMIADLKTKAFVSARSGYVLTDGVSCASWSVKGKQIVAGLGNGSAQQMTPDGTPKALIPKAPQLTADEHISSLLWLGNDTFLIYYTPTNFEAGKNPDSIPMIVTREKASSNFTYSRFCIDPSDPFGMERSPPHHFMARLREWPPAVQDLVVVVSTASDNIGLFANAKPALSRNPDAANTSDKYAVVTMANDSKRAQMPSDPETMSSTSAIGLCIDLSSMERVKGAVPSDEDMTETPTPLPAVFVLDHQGTLSGWWLLYNDSIRKKTGYPGLVALASEQTPLTPAASSTKSPPRTTPGSASAAFGSLQKPAGPTFGGASTPGFGTASLLGSNNSPWGAGGAASANTAPAFGKPSFGTTSSLAASGPGFGQTSVLGKASPWGSAKPSQPFGTQETKPFSQPASGASPFSNTSKSSPFGGLQTQNSLFGQTKPALATETSKGSTITLSSNTTTSFGTMSNVSAFGQPTLSQNSSGKVDADDDMMEDETPESSQIQNLGTIETKIANKTTNLFGLGDGGFRLNNNDPKSAQAQPKLKSDGDNMLGSAFTSALEDVSGSKKATSKDAPASRQATDPKPKFSFGVPSSDPPKAEAESKSKPADDDQEAEDDVVVPEDAPLPPEPTAAQAEILRNTPLPGIISPSEQKVVEQKKLPSPKLQPIQVPPTSPPPLDDASSDVPLPQSPKDKSSNKGLSPAGSSPIDLGAADWSGESKTSKTGTGLESSKSSFSFGSSAQVGQSQPANLFTKISQTTQRSFTAPPAGFNFTAANPPLMFPQPQKPMDQSPRSPSPTRTQQPRSSLGSPSRSLARSPTRQRPVSPQRVPSTYSNPPLPSPGPPGPSAVFTGQLKSPEFGQPAGSRLPAVDETPRRDGPQTVDSQRRVSDLLAIDELVRAQEEIAQPIEPTKDLAPFLASTDYVGNIRPGHDTTHTIERLFYDISSMIDTLGLNARSMSSFVAWHSSEAGTERDRDRDLEAGREDDWHLSEIEDLILLQKDLGDHLETNKVEGVREKIAECVDLLKQLLRFKKTNADLARTVATYNDAAKIQESRSAPLSAEQSSLLKDVRKQYAEVAKLLGEAEDGISLLRARIASAPFGSAGRSPSKMPTVEAVVNTITKMTRMAEQKGGDVDVLEAQMRRLGFRAREGEVEELGMSRLSLGGSPYRASVANGRRRRQTQRRTGTFSADYAEDDESESEELRSSMRSTASLQNGQRKWTRAQGAPEQQAKARAAREQIKALLKAQVAARGQIKAWDARAQ